MILNMNELKTTLKIVKKANKIIAKNFNTFGNHNLEFKKNNEIVSNVDKEVNHFITSKIKKYFPQDKIISEEAKDINQDGNNKWYIDPLDGTTNFVYGLREFATCLSKIDKDNNIKLGIIGIPLAKEIYYTHNNLSFLNKQQIKVSNVTDSLHERNLVFLCDGHSQKSNKKFLEILNKFETADMRFRVFSSAGIELTAVASGKAQGAILPEIHPWDVLGGVLLVKNAGGKATNFKGEEWTINDTELVVSNNTIHNKLLKLVI